MNRVKRLQCNGWLYNWLHSVLDSQNKTNSWIPTGARVAMRKSLRHVEDEKNTIRGYPKIWALIVGKVDESW